MLNNYILNIGKSFSYDVKSFSASEKLGQLYQYEIIFTQTSLVFSLENLLMQNASLIIISPNNITLESNVIHGIITKIEIIGESDDQTLLKCNLEPNICLLNRAKTCRIFQNQQPQDIIRDILKHNKIPSDYYSFELIEQYELLDYITQFNETDWNIIKRICERSGIWFKFEQTQDHEVIKFCDSLQSYHHIDKEYEYIPENGLFASEKNTISSSNSSIKKYHLSLQKNIDQFQLNDYNYEMNGISILSSSSTFNKNEPFNYEWGDGFSSEQEGKKLANIKQAIANNNEFIANFITDITEIKPGDVIKTKKTFNNNNQWLVVSIKASGGTDSKFLSDFVCIPASKTFKTELITQKPKIRGTLPAKIVSADNALHSYVDSFGRYRVHLCFDLDTWSPGGDSLPVRLGKAFTGNKYGLHFPLHPNTEVMLSFVNGDIDRPYISSVMNNSTDLDLINESWNTRNVIRTSANNKIRLEDAKNNEHIKVSTEYAKSELYLGHIVDSTRKQRGQGFELRTNEYGAMKAKKGLLLSSDNQTEADDAQMTREWAIKLLEQSITIAQNIKNIAQNFSISSPTLTKTQEMIDQTFSQLKESGLLSYATSGIATVSNTNQIHSAREDFTVVAGDNIDLASQKAVCLETNGKISAFAEKRGVEVGTDTGNISIFSEKGGLQLDGQQDVDIYSTEESITIAAKKKVYITCGKSYIKLENDNIELGCPNSITLKSSSMPLLGPACADLTEKDNFHIHTASSQMINENSQEPMENISYTVEFDNGEVLKGITDKEGKTIQVSTGRKQRKVKFHC